MLPDLLTSIPPQLSCTPTPPHSCFQWCQCFLLGYTIYASWLTCNTVIFSWQYTIYIPAIPAAAKAYSLLTTHLSTLPRSMADGEVLMDQHREFLSVFWLWKSPTLKKCEMKILWINVTAVREPLQANSLPCSAADTKGLTFKIIKYTNQINSNSIKYIQ